ncbi:hypothetical protein KUTeg_007048 [Tegillarca granosa]|uniref:Dynein heavy chain ATP-binding dynein motor region domain-containing protein n=1 Tax=Tegillarca granosa TaxID=220873 RepID=A0ABQ9FC43_TEGGR|nr:hypothetical protein KUTeg_007048 [Tegillarca granosa]
MQIENKVDDHEVECDPRFRLFIHTAAEPHQVPTSLAAYTSVIYFQQSRYCIEEELLDRFLAKEKARIEDDRTALRQLKKNYKWSHKIHYRLVIAKNIIH